MDAPTPLLLVEDDEDAREVYRASLQQAGFAVTAVGSTAEALAALAQESFPAAVLDIFLPDGRGLALLEGLHKRDPQAVAIVITGFASLDTALAALRLGAHEYLCKPFSSDELVRALRRGLERRRLVLANLQLAEQLAALLVHVQAQGRSPAPPPDQDAGLAALSAWAEQVGATRQDPSLTIAVICEAAARLCEAPLAAVLLVQQGGTRVAGARDQRQRLRPEQELPLSPLLRAALQRAQPVVAPDLLFDEELHDDYLATLGLGSAVVVPVGAHGQVEGLLLCAAEATEAFPEEKVSLLKLIAAQSAPVLERYRQAGAPARAEQDFVDIERLL
jgi:ActR/RegA family two-component response regulator